MPCITGRSTRKWWTRRCGACCGWWCFPGRMDKQVSKGAVNTPAHQKLARKLAEEAITLLKNEGGLLPLGKGVKSIAVIGPNAADAVIEGGGSSRVPPLYRVSPLEALQKQAGSKVRIEYAAAATTWIIRSPSRPAG